MSLQRAAINCEKCYHEAQRENGRREELNYLRRITYEFRNETMVCLEGVCVDSSYHEDYREICRVSEMGRNLCLKCDYSEAFVANLVAKTIP